MVELDANVAASFDITTRGFPTPAISATDLPAGLALTDNNDGTATIAGTPTQQGTFPLVLTAANAQQTVRQTLTVRITSVPAITSPDTAEFTEGRAGSFGVTTTGSPAPGLSLSGDLPAGLTFDDNGDGSATLAGTPQPGTAGRYPVVLTADNTDGSGDRIGTRAVGETSQELTVVVAAAPSTPTPTPSQSSSAPAPSSAAPTTTGPTDTGTSGGSGSLASTGGPTGWTLLTALLLLGGGALLLRRSGTSRRQH